ncbi:hypothetical protein ABTX81_33400 [Kitasatospora sp. NPDC097605]|uniref:hypothetical protein n=1 Tax=Kitasatospora sp. NPDC097605 TaxID=3157226 RepID=UPI0033319382
MSLPRPLLALSAAAVAGVLTLGATQLAAGSARAPAPASAPPAVAAADGLPTDDQLAAALLTADELGSDYTEIPPDTESPSPEAGTGAVGGSGASASPVAGCDALRALLNGTDTEESPGAAEPDEPSASAENPYQEAQFEGADGYPLVTEWLTAEEPEALAADFDTVNSAFSDCHSITFTDDTGESVTFTVTPLALGDRKDAPAIRLDGTLEGVQLNGYLGVERLGDVLLGYGFFQQGSGDSERASLYYRAAVAKAERTLGRSAGSTTAPGTPA